jgi:hypothetical protein
LAEIPDDLRVGSAVVASSTYPPAWYGSPRPAVVTAIDRATKSVTLEAPYGLNAMMAGTGYLTFVFSGHKVADVILCGRATQCDAHGQARVGLPSD